MTEVRRPLIPKEWTSVVTLDGPNGPEETETVNFKGMVLLFMVSEVPDAQPFRRFVAEAVECIREHGCYPAPKKVLGRGRALVVPEPDAVVSRLGPVSSGLANALRKAPPDAGPQGTGHLSLVPPPDGAA